MILSEMPLLWWKVGSLVLFILREKLDRKVLRASCLLVVDFIEQFMSAPIMMRSVLDAFKDMNDERCEIVSRNSSSCPEVGAYTEMRSSEHFVSWSWIPTILS